MIPVSGKTLAAVIVIALIYSGAYVARTYTWPYVDLPSSAVFREIEGLPVPLRTPLTHPDKLDSMVNLTDVEGPVELRIVLRVLNNGGSGWVHVGCKIIDATDEEFDPKTGRDLSINPATEKVVMDVSGSVYCEQFVSTPIEFNVTVPGGRIYRFVPYTVTALGVLEWRIGPQSGI